MFRITPQLVHRLLGTTLLLPLVALSACKKPEATATAPPPTPVKLQTIQSGQVEDSAQFVGNLEAKQKVSLTPQISGRISQILVAQGEAVSQGTPIVQLQPDKQNAQIEGSIAGASSASADLQTAQAQARAAQADVSAKDAVIRSKDAAVQKATADVQLARTNYERSQALVAEGAVAQQDLDTKTNALKSATAQRDAAQQDLEAARRDYSATAADAQAAQAVVNAKAASLQNAQAQVRSAGVDLNYNQVAAPITGIVGDLSTLKVGDFVTPGQAITTIIQNDELDMRISVPTNRSGQLRTGLPVTLLDANTSKALASGSITFISPQVDTASQAIVTKARFPNQSGKLRDGQYVQAKITWSKGNGLTVPTTAITRIGGQSFVFVAKDTPCHPEKDKPAGGESGDKKAAPAQPEGLVACQVPIQVGDIQGSGYKVLSGLKPGDRIAVSNILKLRDGVPIQAE